MAAPPPPPAPLAVPQDPHVMTSEAGLLLLQRLQRGLSVWLGPQAPALTRMAASERRTPVRIVQDLSLAVDLDPIAARSGALELPARRYPSLQQAERTALDEAEATLHAALADGMEAMVTLDFLAADDLRPVWIGDQAHLCELACPTCRGAAALTCQACTGRGRLPCPESGCDCGATRCTGCGGSGQRLSASSRAVPGSLDAPESPEPEAGRCARCDGRGMLACRTCGGKATIACGTCSGRGRLTCGHCKGDGSFVEGFRPRLTARRTTRAEPLDRGLGALAAALTDRHFLHRNAMPITPQPLKRAGARLEAGWLAEVPVAVLSWTAASGADAIEGHSIALGLRGEVIRHEPLVDRWLEPGMDEAERMAASRDVKILRMAWDWLRSFPLGRAAQAASRSGGSGFAQATMLDSDGLVSRDFAGRVLALASRLRRRIDHRRARLPAILIGTSCLMLAVALGGTIGVEDALIEDPLTRVAMIDRHGWVALGFGLALAGIGIATTLALTARRIADPASGALRWSWQWPLPVFAFAILSVLAAPVSYGLAARMWQPPAGTVLPADPEAMADQSAVTAPAGLEAEEVPQLLPVPQAFPPLPPPTRRGR